MEVKRKVAVLESLSGGRVPLLLNLAVNLFPRHTEAITNGQFLLLGKPMTEYQILTDNQQFLLEQEATTKIERGDQSPWPDSVVQQILFTLHAKTDELAELNQPNRISPALLQSLLRDLETIHSLTIPAGYESGDTQVAAIAKRALEQLRQVTPAVKPAPRTL